MPETVAANQLSLEFGERERRLLQECIHCGFCLPSCPTYITNGKEMDSPRGRLYLMETAINNRVDLAESFFRHMDLCLVCRACESACPSGVQFGKLMERTRTTLLPYRARSILAKTITSLLLNWVIPSRSALSFTFRLGWLYQRTGLDWLTTHSLLRHLVPKRIRLLQESLTTIPARRFGKKETQIFAAVGETRGKVALFTGCVMDHLFPQVHRATVRILRWNGYDVLVPEGQICCGALHVHSGEKAAAEQLAKRNLSVFQGDSFDAIIVNAAGCSSQLKSYEHLLSDNGSKDFADKVKDLTEFMAAIDLCKPDGPLRMKVVYDEPCHLIHAQGITTAPRRLIASLPGVELLPLLEADRCCGSAGSYVILETLAALEILNRKMDFIESSGADAVVTANPGCQIQLQWGARRRNLSIQILHIAELVDLSYRTNSGYLSI